MHRSLPSSESALDGGGAGSSDDLDRDFQSCVEAFDDEFDHIYQTLRRHGLAAADAEDAAQDVFLIMWRRWSEYDQRRSLRAWLAGIAFRVAFHHRRRSGREVPGGFIDIVDHQPTPEEHAFETSGRALVARVLAALPERERIMVRLHDIDDVPMRDIAEGLRIPLQTAHTRLRKGRRNFARLLRRLSTVTDARAAATAALGPALLRDERPEPAPRERRRRALARAGAVVPFAPVLDPLAEAGAPAPAGTGAGLAAGSPVARLLLVVVAVAAPLTLLLTRERAVPVAAARPQPVEVVRPAVATPPRFLPAPAPLPASASGPGDRLVGLAAARAASLSRGLVGYWRFDDGEGSAGARDLSGNGNHCLLRGPEGPARWTRGRVGGALELTGVNWLECPEVAPLARLGREITIALWVKRTGTEQALRALVSRQIGTERSDHFQLGFRGERVWLRSMRGRSPAAGRPMLARGRWYHVAGTIAADGTARVFVDGIEIGRNEDGGRPEMGGGSNPLLIGAAFNGARRDRPAERLRGLLDELVIYDRALAPAEIRALATEDVDPDESEPAAAVAGAVAPAGAAEQIWIEPEQGAITAPLEIHRDPGASGGSYVTAATGSNARKDVPVSGRTTLRFQVRHAGAFKLWGRLIAPTRADDSFWLQVDDGPWIQWNDIPAGAGWHWAELFDDRASKVPTFDLAAGSHTLTVAYREDGAKLDRLLVTSDPTFSPTR